MEIDETKRRLFRKAFDQKNVDEQNTDQESSSFLQNAIKGNRLLNQSIDGRENNSKLKEISIGNNQTNQPPLNFNVDLEDDGSGKI